MNALLWVLGVLGAALLSAEVLGWITPACLFLLRKGAQHLPDDWQSRYTEEWQAELLALPEGGFTRIVWTARTLIGVRSMRATLAEGGTNRQPHSELPESDRPMQVSWTPPSRVSTVLRITLGAELRHLRLARGITPDDAGWQIRSSAARLHRLESGQTTLRERDVLDLLLLYGVTDAHTIDAFRRLARHGDNSGWWHRYTDQLPSGLPPYVALEQSASILRSYGPFRIPDLLQTHDYAQVSLMDSYLSDSEIERSLDMRYARQSVLTRPEPARLWAVIDESALRRSRGGVRVMRTQLEHLVDMSHLPNLNLQILPLRSGAGGAGTAFTIFRLPHPALPDAVHVEQLTSSLYLDAPDEVDYYTALMENLGAQAPPPSSTIPILRQILADFDS
jgi:hypothetical protein